MLAPDFTNADFLAALQAFFPKGRIWPREPDSVQSQALSGFASIFVKTSSDAKQLIKDIFPPTTYALLPDWESTLGLPDEVIGQLFTTAQRVAMVVERFCNTGGQSVFYIIAFAANLGYTITVTEYVPARAGRLKAGQPVCGAAWAHAWCVTCEEIPVTTFQAGRSGAGDALRSWGNVQLLRELSRISPAHTIEMFDLA